LLPPCCFSPGFSPGLGEKLLKVAPGFGKKKDMGELLGTSDMAQVLHRCREGL